MKASTIISVFAALVAPINVHASDVDPVSKTIEMLADLEAKIIKQGEEAQKQFDEFSEWCDDRSKNVGFEIKTGKAEVADLSAAIEKESAKISAFGTKIDELAAGIAANEGDLKAATKVRESEAADFAAEEKEIRDVISTLERAIAVLSRGGPSMIQLKGVQNVAQALSAMVQASVLSTADASRLSALVQETQSSDDEGPGAPAAAVYEGHSGGIISTLEDLLDKAQAQLEKARKEETNSAHNYAMLKQSLDDEIGASDKDLADAKAGLAGAEEAKAAAAGDLSVTSADLREDEGTLSSLHQDCKTGAEDFAAETKSRGEELQALAAAKKVLGGAAGATDQTYGAASFLQVATSKLASGEDLAKYEVVHLIRDLARKEKSTALAQLASKMASVIKYGASSGIRDPFAKVKSMISEMIAKLEADGQAEASQKEFCDKETAETEAKKEEKKHEISKLSTRINSKSAKSAKLKEEVAELQKELADLARSQAEMDKIRAEEKAVYQQNAPEMQAGIKAVQSAIAILRDYYESSGGAAHGAAAGAGNGIVSMLEVVMSDFTKGLAEIETTESTAAREYEKATQVNKITKTSKDQDVKYKTQEAASLDKAVAETTSDKEGVQSELDALLEYLAKLAKMCVAKAEPYAERKARREAEIAGLKQALTILEGEALLQKSSKRRILRGKH